MTRKTSIIAGAALLVLSCAASSIAEAQTGRTTGNFYLGAYGGYGWNDVDVSPGPTLDVDGVDYGVLAGVELRRFFGDQNNFAANTGLEAHYGWSNADEGGAEKDTEWGISLRPGIAYLAEKTPLGLKPYGILGYRRAEFSAAGVGSDDYDGFELGIGSELVAYDNVGVRLDYTHVFYEENNGLDPSENDLRLGMIFHF